ncbi:lasso RiPP family leader peptide-containing protein [Saccharopolyspora phatthalungensis]|uniref:Uncharacterized protein n=1 Tax=Saccharopolyspora phatthalungensis TaxID=664693 RepID=A0A840QJ44_9PSEU|nr:lasso RiPP family leader peptide-containing protein [Saccharopolyspora phatthalungensis]MBB5158765.1 hypothetical protein [Saccharopolyspora phatthalungensis]
MATLPPSTDGAPIFRAAMAQPGLLMIGKEERMVESTELDNDKAIYVAPLLEEVGDFAEQTQGNQYLYVEGFFSYLGTI